MMHCSINIIRTFLLIFRPTGLYSSKPFHFIDKRNRCNTVNVPKINTLVQLPSKVGHSYQVRWVKATIILAYSEGSFDLNSAEAPNILT